MKKLLALITILMSAHTVNAGTVDTGSIEDAAFLRGLLTLETIKHVDLKSVNCDELKGIAEKESLIHASGFIVAANTYDCLNFFDRRYEFFEAKGAHIFTKTGRCVVWTCEGRRDPGGRSSS